MHEPHLRHRFPLWTWSWSRRIRIFLITGMLDMLGLLLLSPSVSVYDTTRSQSYIVMFLVLNLPLFLLGSSISTSAAARRARVLLTLPAKVGLGHLPFLQWVVVVILLRPDSPTPSTDMFRDRDCSLRELNLAFLCIIGRSLTVHLAKMCLHLLELVEFLLRRIRQDEGWLRSIRDQISC